MSFIKRLSLKKLRKNSSSPTKDSQLPQAQYIEQQGQLPEDDIAIGSGNHGTSTTDMEPLPTPEKQTVLLLHGAKQPYQLTEDYPVPQLEGEHDVLVRTQTIGLNPIDWKAPSVSCFHIVPCLREESTANFHEVTSTLPFRNYHTSLVVSWQVKLFRHPGKIPGSNQETEYVTSVSAHLSFPFISPLLTSAPSHFISCHTSSPPDS